MFSSPTMDDSSSNVTSSSTSRLFTAGSFQVKLHEFIEYARSITYQDNDEMTSEQRKQKVAGKCMTLISACSQITVMVPLTALFLMLCNVCCFLNNPITSYALIMLMLNNKIVYATGDRPMQNV